MYPLIRWKCQGWNVNICIPKYSNRESWHESHHGRQTGKARDDISSIGHDDHCVCVPLCQCSFVIVCLAVPALVVWNSVVWKDLNQRCPKTFFISSCIFTCLMWFNVCIFVCGGHGLKKVQREKKLESGCSERKSCM